MLGQGCAGEPVLKYHQRLFLVHCSVLKQAPFFWEIHTWYKWASSQVHLVSVPSVDLHRSDVNSSWRVDELCKWRNKAVIRLSEFSTIGVAEEMLEHSTARVWLTQRVVKLAHRLQKGCAQRGVWRTQALGRGGGPGGPWSQRQAHVSFQTLYRWGWHHSGGCKRLW